MTDVWGDVPTWLAGVATAGALWYALAQGSGQRKRELKQQLESNTARRRAQAELISAWPARVSETGDGGLFVNLSNASKELVYDLVIVPVQIQGEGPSTGDVWLHQTVTGDKPYGEMPYVLLQALPPGEWWTWVETDYGPGVEIAFTDRAGRGWVRHRWGPLEELANDGPFDYELERPLRYNFDLRPGVFDGL